jgi:hypothetical protein
MAGPSGKIEISYELLPNGDFIRRVDDLVILSTDLVKLIGSILKGNIVNLLAIHSQPLDQPYVAFEDPIIKKNKYGYTYV